MKNKYKFHLLRALPILAIVFLLVHGSYSVALAEGASADKGGGVSEQATAGEVPPIVMISHGNAKNLEAKILKEFGKLESIKVRLHENKFIDDIELSGKLSKPVSISLERDKVGSLGKKFYISETKRFMSKHSNLFGVQNLEHNIKLDNFLPKLPKGNVGLLFNVTTYSILQEASLIRVFFDSEGSIYAITYNLPNITPELLSALNRAKTHGLPVDEVKKIASKQFLKYAVDRGLTKDSVATGVPFSGKYFEFKMYAIEKPPYIVWQLYHSLDNRLPRYEFSGVVWRLQVDAFTGELLHINERVTKER